MHSLYLLIAQLFSIIVILSIKFISSHVSVLSCTIDTTAIMAVILLLL